MKTLSKLLVLCAALSAVAYAQVPLAGSQLEVSGQASLNTQGAYMGWNKASLGETDYQNVQGTGVGGFCWYNGNSVTQTQLMCLDFHGTLTVTNLNGTLGLTTPANAAVTQLQVTSTATLASQGAYIGWNKATTGETDFQTSPGSGTGGFNWYTGSTLQMSLNGSTGALTNSNGFIGPTSGTHTGNSSTATSLAATPTPCSGAALAGGVNASGNSVNCATNIPTATALAATPSQCGAGTQATGIAASGAANCTPTKTLWASTTSVCSTPNTNGSCTTSLTWPSPQFTTGTYLVVCQGYNMTGGIVNIAVTGETVSTVTLTLTNGTASQAVTSSFSQIVCQGNGV